ncbi:hypothetical protein PUN28_017101 [Cardiocondyla obscurior]|uniref:Uncharacterized protein n=1 Tax=Cardiocondyla obscurior TaxID=286306 RepID=A0AAW2ELL9_9HYME
MPYHGIISSRRMNLFPQKSQRAASSRKGEKRGITRAFQSTALRGRVEEDGGERCIQLRPIIIFPASRNPARCSRIPSLFDFRAADGHRRSEAGNLSCHKEISYIGRCLESLFRALPVDIRELHLQPVALCLSLRPRPPPSRRSLPPPPSLPYSANGVHV